MWPMLLIRDFSGKKVRGYILGLMKIDGAVDLEKYLEY